MAFSEPVLVVDDDLVFAAVATSILQALGVKTVVTAHDGQAGVQALHDAKDPIGLIILDLNMPKLDGLAFMRAISMTGFSGHIVVSSGESGKIVQSAQNMGRMLGMNVLGALKKNLSSWTKSPSCWSVWKNQLTRPGTKETMATGRMSARTC